MVPFCNIEQVIVLQNSWETASEDEAYRVIIVPTAATGASVIKRQYPQIISFSWPDKGNDHLLTGRSIEESRLEKHTYLAILQTVFDEQLERFGKTVINTTDPINAEAVVVCSATLNPIRKTRHDVKATGHLYFLETGILFSSEGTWIYLPFRSLDKVHLVLIKDLVNKPKKTGSKNHGPQRDSGQLVSLQLHCSTTEPFYVKEDSAKSSEDSSNTTLLSFTNIPLNRFSVLKLYMEKHNVDFKAAQQTFHDFDKNQVMTGWDPIQSEIGSNGEIGFSIIPLNVLLMCIKVIFERSMKSYAVAVAVAAFAVVSWLIYSTPRSGFDPLKVLDQGRSITSRSWEFGTLAEALLEFHDPKLTVFDSDAFPNGMTPAVLDPSKVTSLAFAKSVIWTNDTDLLVDGDGSAADPASLGTAAVLLSYHDRSYLEAAKRQAEYLLTKAKRFRVTATQSAISHREDISELWGDFIYMVPPFLAYYGVATQDIGYLEVAVAQCQLYSDVLSTNITLEDGQSCSGLWRHIVSDPSHLEPGVCCTDPDVWLTASAWAVAGMTRVLATIMHWQPPLNSLISQTEYLKFQVKSRTRLKNLIGAMLQCTRDQARDEGSDLLKNYLDGTSHRSAAWAYGDAAGTALMAAAVYRLAVLLPETYDVPLWLHWADQLRGAVSRHVDENGVVSPVADVGHVPSESPVQRTSEGQSMVILMFSAWRDCVDAGVCSTIDGLWRELFRD